MTLYTLRHRRIVWRAGLALGFGVAAVLAPVLGAAGPAAGQSARVARQLVRCAATATGTTLGACAATFTLPDAQGHQVALARYRGHPVLLNFWGIGCPNCEQELPDLLDFARAFHRRGGVVLGVNTWGEPRVEIAAYAQIMRVNWPLLVDPEMRVGDLYGVRGTPTNVFIDRRGVIRALEAGPLQLEDFRRLSARL